MSPLDDPLVDDLGPKHFPALEPGESFVWFGRPGSGSFRSDAYGPGCIVPALLGPVTFFVAFFAVGPMLKGEVPTTEFVAVAIYLVLFVSACCAMFALMRGWRTTRYALTNRRVMICRSSLFRKRRLRTIPVSGPSVPVISQIHWDGSGDLVFLEANKLRARRFDQGPVPLIGEGFLDVPDVREVERIVCEVFRAFPEINAPRKPV